MLLHHRAYKKYKGRDGTKILLCDNFTSNSGPVYKSFSMFFVVVKCFCITGRTKNIKAEMEPKKNFCVVILPIILDLPINLLWLACNWGHTGSLSIKETFLF